VFDVAAENETTLVSSLVMKGGQRFNHVRVKLADLEAQGAFDPGQRKSIASAEASGQPNSVWIARMGVK